MKRTSKYCITIALILGLASLVGARPMLPPPTPAGGPAGPGGPDGPQRTPAPVTVDQVIHNQGNIATTVDNWGYIGGYQFYGLPSGEYPRNSGQNYLAEIRYWMGAVTVSGDTLVANSVDDFQSVPVLSSGQEENMILLSTDTTRYHYYDVSDTTGAGYGSPAQGWQVWSGEANDYVYTQNYDPNTSSFYDGGPLSVQESHYRFADNAGGPSLMGLEMTHTVLSWNYCYNEDFMFMVLEITNTTAEDYTDFAFGLYVDLDVGGADGEGYFGELEDLVGSDSSESLAWIYDEDFADDGWDEAAGVMGTKYLETPGGGGMTAFRTGDWAELPDDDPGRFSVINSTQYDGSLPPTDQYYVQCTRGIDLDAGQTVRVVYALVAGEDEADFRDNASLAQELYDNYFVGPEPPNTPTLTAVGSHEKVYLSWNDTAQVTVDPLSGENDFAGYKLYRSDNRGMDWGEELRDDEINNDCLEIDYETIARYSVSDPADPIPRSIIDADLINGVEYWYCLVAFDSGASETGVDVLQTGFGVPGSASNVVRVTPRTDPAGFYEAAGTVTHTISGAGLLSEGEIFPTVFDRDALQGANYQVVFEDSPAQTYWHLVNVTTGDTILADQALIDEEADLYEVIEGLRVVVNDGDRVPRSMGQTGFAGVDTTLVLADFYGPSLAYLLENNSTVKGNVHFRSTYEIRYTGDANPAPSIWEYWYPGDPTYIIPFECWNTTTNERVSLAVWDQEFDGDWDPHDLLAVINYPYDEATPFDLDAFPFHYSWMIELDPAAYSPGVGDVFTIEGASMNGPGDVFAFAASGINANLATSALANIRVAPDPYYAYATQWETTPGETNIRFQNLPDKCTIRIYTLSGDLVTTLDHADDSGDEEWNLLTGARRMIVSGVYIYHVESRYGDHLGRFAVVK